MCQVTLAAQEEGGNTANVRQGNVKRLFFSLGESRKVWSPHKLGDSFNSDLEGFKQTKCPTREQASPALSKFYFKLYNDQGTIKHDPVLSSCF